MTDSIARSREQANRIANIVRSDPKLGTRIDVPGDVSSPANTTIIVAATACNCNARQIEAVKKALTKGINVKVILFAPPGIVTLQPKLRQIRRALVFDMNLDLKRQLNANFSPRAYALDKEGRLVWKSDRIIASWNSLIEEAQIALQVGG